jgi:Domain of unknown function (DUF4190)
MADQPPSLPQTSSALPPSRAEPLAIWSLVLAILSWFFCLLLGSIPAIVCGHLARSRILRANGALQGMNFALAGLIIAYLEIPFGVLGGIMLADMIRSDRVRSHDLAVQKKEIASDDGKLKVTASGFWVKKLDLNKEAKLQVANENEDMYLLVFTDAKSAVGGMTLEQRHQTARDRKLQGMQNASATQTVPLTIDGHAALQDDVSGTQQRINLVFLHTTVDEGDYFQQIVAWTRKSRWPKQNQELREMTGSFRCER